jgi:hypothetical protein
MVPGNDKAKELYKFLKDMGPKLEGEKKDLKNVPKDYRRKSDKRKEFNSKVRKASSKLSDPRMVKLIRESGPAWFRELGKDHEAYSCLLEKLGELSEKSPRVSLAAASKLEEILDHLNDSPNLDHSHTVGFALVDDMVGRILDGAGELSKVDEDAAEFALDYMMEWPAVVRSRVYPHGLGAKVKRGDYNRLIGIIKEAVEKNEKKSWKKLIQETETMLVETPGPCGDMKDYFEKVRGPYDLTGKYLDGPLNWFRYEPGYLKIVFGKTESSHFGLRKEFKDSFLGEMKKVIELRELYDSSEEKGLRNDGYNTESIEPTKRERGLQAIMEFALKLGYDMQDYRYHMANPGDGKILYGRTMILSGMVDNVTIIAFD